MRLGGLASGMDTDQMVKELMKAESIKVDRVEADKQLLEWKKEALNSLNKDLANFILDSKKDLGYNSLGRPGNQDWTKKATSSDESIGTAKAGKGAFEGKHTVEVTKLAKGVSGVSSEIVKESTWEGKNVGAFDFNINGKKVSVSAGDSLKTIAKKINSSGAGVQASYDDKLGRFFISTEKEGTDAKIEFTAEEGTNLDSLDSFLETIKVGITKLNEDGKQVDKNGNLINENGNLIDENGNLILKEEKPVKGTLTLIESGINKGFIGEAGKAIYNGIPTEITSNQFEFNGVKFDAKTEGVFTVEVKSDTDAIVDKVKDFVENYNKLIEQANNLVKEKQNRNYKPLTADEREAMSEKEVELWEKKAKAGVARGDMDIEKMLSALRSDLYKDLEVTTGKFKNISQLGITTQEYKSGSAGGMLQIDEEKLRKAISEDADSVLEVLFKYDAKDVDKNAQTTKNEGSLAGTSEKGLFSRIFDNITDGMKSLIEKSGPGEDSALFRKVKSTIMTDFVTKGGKYSGKGSISDIDDDMLKFTKRIDDLKMQLFRKENMYYARFTAMEKAMQRANSQGDWLMQQMM